MKRALCCLLVGLVALCLRVESMAEGPGLQPPAVQTDGVTLQKSAVQLAPDAWQVTLQVANDNITPPTANIVLVLDCSRSMEELAADAEETRLEAAKAAANELLLALSAHGAAVHVGVVAFSGQAQVVLPLVALVDAKGNLNQEGMDSLQNAVQTTWQVATKEKGTPVYGIRGGTNLEQGLQVGATLLHSGAAQANYLLVLTDGQPTVAGVEERCEVRTTDGTLSLESPQYCAQEEILAATQETANAVLAQESLTRLFVVGFDTEILTPYASAESAFAVSAQTLDSVFSGIVEQMSRLPLTGAVVEELLGTRFTCDAAGITVSDGFAVLQQDTRQLRWVLPTHLAQGQRATMSYTLHLNDPELEGAGKVVPVHSASRLAYAQTLPDGTSHTLEMEFPQPMVLYQSGVLRVTRSGFSADPETLAVSAPMLVTAQAKFSLLAPEELSGYHLNKILLNGQEISTELLDLQRWELPVLAGETTVEYAYILVQEPTALAIEEPVLAAEMQMDSPTPPPAPQPETVQAVQAPQASAPVQSATASSGATVLPEEIFSPPSLQPGLNNDKWEDKLVIAAMMSGLQTPKGTQMGQQTDAVVAQVQAPKAASANWVKFAALAMLQAAASVCVLKFSINRKKAICCNR